MRTYDVAAFQLTPDTRPEVQRLWAANSGTGITGILKLAQRFLVAMLTIHGTRPFSPESGSSLLQAARTGRIRSDVDARIEFQFALSGTEDTLRAEEDAAMPDDERYADATLTGVTFSPGFVAYRVLLASRAGGTRTLEMPVQTIPTTPEPRP